MSKKNIILQEREREREFRDRKPGRQGAAVALGQGQVGVQQVKRRVLDLLLHAWARTCPIYMITIIAELVESVVETGLCAVLAMYWALG